MPQPRKRQKRSAATEAIRQRKRKKSRAAATYLDELPMSNRYRSGTCFLQQFRRIIVFCSFNDNTDCMCPNYIHFGTRDRSGHRVIVFRVSKTRLLFIELHVHVRYVIDGPSVCRL